MNLISEKERCDLEVEKVKQSMFIQLSQQVSEHLSLREKCCRPTLPRWWCCSWGRGSGHWRRQRMSLDDQSIIELQQMVLIDNVRSLEWMRKCLVKAGRELADTLRMNYVETIIQMDKHINCSHFSCSESDDSSRPAPTNYGTGKTRSLHSIGFAKMGFIIPRRCGVFPFWRS